MEELLKIWCNNPDNMYPEANVETLLRFLEEIDRYDVSDDIMETIGKTFGIQDYFRVGQFRNPSYEYVIHSKEKSHCVRKPFKEFSPKLI